MHVLLHDRVPNGAKPFVHQLMEGQGLAWDEPPLARAPWSTYAGISSAVAQAARLFGQELEFDVWGEHPRLTWTTLTWEPLPWRFGWWVACRPFAGVSFTKDPAESRSPLDALPYLESWPHGYLLREELRAVVPALRERVAALALQLQDPDEPLDPARVERVLREPQALSQGDFLDLFAQGCEAEREGWQLRRALILLRAAAQAQSKDADLICLGH